MTDEEFRAAAYLLGREAKFSLRKIARDAGMTTLPPAVVYLQGVRVSLPAEDLTVLLPEEAHGQTR